MIKYKSACCLVTLTKYSGGIPKDYAAVLSLKSKYKSKSITPKSEENGYLP
jgi:hypothetical protein